MGRRRVSGEAFHWEDGDLPLESFLAESRTGFQTLEARSQTKRYYDPSTCGLDESRMWFIISGS